MHSPYWPPVDRWGDGGKRRKYLSVLETMDRQLGVLFDHIRNDEELRKNTLVLICSDNGPEKGAGRAGPFKGLKTHLFEGGIRSPLIVWGPGFVDGKARGRRNRDSVLAAIDLAPSLLGFAGVEKPAGVKYDGEEVLTTLLGGSRDSRKGPIFFSRPPDRKSYYGLKNLPDLAMRKGRWKLLCDYDGSRPLLYDLLADPGETRNLAERESERVEAMVREVLEWFRDMPSGER